MDRRQLLAAGGSLFALTGCANMGMGMGGGSPAGLSPEALARDAAVARAVLPQQTPRAELLQKWTGPYEGVPPWPSVTADKLKTAIVEGIDLQRAEITAIADNPEPPTFANTMVAMQMAGEPLGRALSLFGETAGTEREEDSMPVNPAEWLASLGAQREVDTDAPDAPE